LINDFAAETGGLIFVKKCITSALTVHILKIVLIKKEHKIKPFK